MPRQQGGEHSGQGSAGCVGVGLGCGIIVIVSVKLSRGVAVPDAGPVGIDIEVPGDGTGSRLRQAEVERSITSTQIIPDTLIFLLCIEINTPFPPTRDVLWSATQDSRIVFALETWVNRQVCVSDGQDRLRLAIHSP